MSGHVQISYWKIYIPPRMIQKILNQASSGSTLLHQSAFPWLLSSQYKPKSYSLWQFLKRKHLLNIGTTRINGLLKGIDSPYGFPQDFLPDASKVLQETFASLSRPDVNIILLSKNMEEDIAKKYLAGWEILRQQSKSVSLTLIEPKVKINGYYFTYGPFPIPNNFVGQDWLDSITFILPKEDAEFTSHPRQTEIVKIATESGCYVRIDCSVECKVDYTIKDIQSDIPLIRDSRKSFECSFTSPFFTPWDEIFRFENGKWVLNWKWKISDIDGASKQVREDRKEFEKVLE